MRKPFIAILLLLLCTARAPAGGRAYSLAVVGTFTTTSKLFYNPTASDDLLRGQYLGIDNIFGGGINIRYELPAIHSAVGVSAEFLTRTQEITFLPSVLSLTASDGFSVIPLECTGYFYIPVGGDALRFYMGGGLGMYLGTRKYEFPGATAETVDRTTGYGIHILTGLEYDLDQRISLRSEVKFRNAQFETVNQFHQPSITYNNTVIPLDQRPFPSRIAVDGMGIALALVVYP